MRGEFNAIPMQSDNTIKRKAVFLDRDGVITQEPPHYAHGRDQMRLIAGAAKAIRLLNDNDFMVIIVTNQAGIARGIYGEDAMHEFHGAMEEELAKESGARVDAIYWCAHHPEAAHEKYKMICDCRKPEIGMLLRASVRHSINLAQSYMVGDKWSDIQAGQKAGCKTILVQTGHAGGDRVEGNRANLHARDIMEAVQFILNI